MIKTLKFLIKNLNYISNISIMVNVNSIIKKTKTDESSTEI